MHIVVRVKQMGRKKGALVDKAYEIEPVSCLRDLIRSLVYQEVAAWNTRRQESAEPDAPKQLTLLAPLSPEELENKGATGKIDFGLRYGGSDQNPEKAVTTALMAFHDGLYRVFAGEEELLELDAPLVLAENAILTFIRLKMLTGSW